MTIINILLIFVNILVLATILWLRRNKKKKLVNRNKKRKDDLIAYQAKLDARIDYHKGRR